MMRYAGEDSPMPFVPNHGKSLNITTNYGVFARYPVKTHVIMASDSLRPVLDHYLAPYLQPGDYVFISEKIVAITQGRAFPVEEIKPGRWAKILSSFVQKSAHGIGLGMPCTMELAIREIGLLKILFAAVCSAVTKLFGIHGVFYRILGEQARAIDGPCDYTIPPYNRYAKLAPSRPNEAAKELAAHIGAKIVIIDANDLGVEVLGRSHPDEIDIDFCKEVFGDNPLGQGAEQTPICILRKAWQEDAEPPSLESCSCG
ncbi:MAG: coenzyme F420-0:L-glutamate ligase [Clostridiales bacterium]